MDEPDEDGHLAGYPTNPLTTAAGGSRVASTWTLITATHPVFGDILRIGSLPRGTAGRPRSKALGKL
jgi:hypothetical protein